MEVTHHNAASQEKRHRNGLSLQFAERKLLLLGMDLVILNGALFLMLSLWPASVFSRLLPRFPWYVLLLSGLWLVISAFFNVYDLAKAASAVHSIWAAGTSVLITLTIYILIPYLTPLLPNRRTQVVIFFLMALLGITLWRFIYATIFTQPSFRHRALVIGAGWSGRTLVNAIQETASETGNPYLGTGYELLGFVDDDPAKQENFIEGAPVLGTGADLIRLVNELNPDEIIIAITHSQRINPHLFQAILACYEMGIPITTMAMLYEKMTGRVPVQHAGQDLTVLLPVSRPSGFRFYLALRRIGDILIAFPGLLITLLVTPFIWLGNLLTEPGAVFYQQTRVGENGKEFEIVKFRSMVIDAEAKTGAVWAQEDDPRITPMGKFLRRARLDELPQFWNVLKGEMTLIGPRPERPEMVSRLSRDIPFYGLRHAVKPGITGWAQVRYRYGASDEDAFVKLQYDLYYIKHLGPFVDFSVLIKTVQVVLGMKGR